MTSFLIKTISTIFLFLPGLSTESDINLINISPPPAKKIIINDEEITAKAYYIYDLKTLSPIAEKKQDEKLAIASLTKLMTALIIIEEHNPEEIIIIKNQKIWQTAYSTKVALLQLEQISVANLMRALLIPSANNAATALAIYNSEQNNITTNHIKEFTKKMNQRAEILGLINTKFQNPHGLDNDDDQATSETGYSTAREITLLAKFLLKNKKQNWQNFISTTINTKQKTIYSKDKKIEHQLKNTNELLELPNIYGIKTGTTDKAGECLITLYKNQDKEIIITILGSLQRFEDAKKIMKELNLE